MTLSATDTLPLLYSYRRCPYAMRSRMAILHAGRTVRVFDVVMRDKPAALLNASPKGTVPVLVLPDGRVIDESMDIVRWACEPADPAGWWARAQTPDNLRLLALNDGPFKQQLDRFKYPQRFDGDVGAARASAITVLLNPLEDRLRDAPWLGGDTPCATDIALFPFVRQFAAVDPLGFASSPWPAVQRWLAAWSGSALFEACMARVPSQCATVFPASAA